MNDYKLTTEYLLASKVGTEASLLYFTRFWFKELRGSKFIVNWHHKEMCRIAEFVYEYRYKYYNFNIPPRYGKTEIIGVNLPAQSLAKNPRANFLYITASDELRSETSIRIRDIITHSLFKQLYGVEIKKDQTAKNLWRTTQGGGLKTATIFGQIIGFGAGRMVENDPDLIGYIKDFEGGIILDDINKIIDIVADNVNNRKVLSTLFNTILSRVNTPDTPIINIQHRSGENDTTNALSKFFLPEETINLILPVELRQEDADRLNIPELTKQLKGKKRVPLCEAKHDLSAIDRLRNHPETKVTFQTQYMQDPRPQEGLMFPESELNRFELKDLKGEPDAVIGFGDTADEGIDNLSSPIAEIYGDRIFITDVVFTKEKTEKTQPKVTAQIIGKKVDRYRFESNAAGKEYARRIMELLEEFGYECDITWRASKGHKGTRILNESWYILKHFWFRKDYEMGLDYDRFMTQLTSYKKDEAINRKITTGKDDAPDSLTGLSIFVRKDFVDFDLFAK